MFPVPDWSQPNYWFTVILINQTSKVLPASIIKALKDKNIESRPVWRPMHMQPVFSKCMFYSHTSGRTSIAEDLFKWGVCIPSGTSLTETEQDKVITIIRNQFI